MEPVLVRVFGDKTDLLISRRQEMQNILCLARAGFGAQVSQRLVTCPVFGRCCGGVILRVPEGVSAVQKMQKVNHHLIQ